MSRNATSVAMASLLGVCLSVPLAAIGQDRAEMSHDGLVLVEGTRADTVYSLPEADFTVYDSFIILEPVVAFKKNWQRDINRSSAGRRITNDDMERMKLGMAELFLEVFTSDLEEGGYSVVTESAANVMILKPAIIDLEVTAPDTQTSARSRTYVTNAGSARIFIEFYDSVTGQILARAVDYQRARNSSSFQWASVVSNRAEARRVLGRWAGMLVDSLDEVRGDR